MAGVCSNCSIVATNYGFNNPGTYTNPNPNFNYLLQLALNGARVINMSWSGWGTSPNYNYYQWVIDEIYDIWTSGKELPYYYTKDPNYDKEDDV